MEATRIKFTATTVREVAERVKQLTGGRFALGAIGSHPEYGTSYSDAHGQITWYGAKGAREACAYYTAAAMRWMRQNGIKPEGDDGEFLLAVQVAYMRSGDFTRADREGFDRWEARGAERAEEIFNGMEGATGK